MSAPWVKCHFCREVKLLATTSCMFVTRTGGEREEIGRVCEPCTKQLEAVASEVRTEREVSVRKGGVNIETTKTTTDITRHHITEAEIKEGVKMAVRIVAAIAFCLGFLLGAFICLLATM